jgi:hypothetical protein
MKRSAWISGTVGSLVALGLVAAVPATTASAAVSSPSVGMTTSVSPSVAGQRVVLKATVVDPSQPASSITGTMTFSDGATVLGVASVTSAKASLATTALGAGSHALVASFTPTGGGNAVASQQFAQTVDLAGTTVSLVSSKPNANYGAAGNVTATVKAVAPATGVPTGTVDFSIDGGWYWTSSLDSRGKAVLSLADIYPAFYPGTYSITATYSGDVNYTASTTPTAIAQTLIGISSPPVTTISLNTKGQVSFSPTSFRLSSANPVGCNVTITNTTSSAVALVYGTPGSWKRLPGGVIAAGASGGVGVGLSNFTGYFSAMGAANYVAIHCI